MHFQRSLDCAVQTDTQGSVCNSDFGSVALGGGPESLHSDKLLGVATAAGPRTTVVLMYPLIRSSHPCVAVSRKRSHVSVFIQ